MEFRNGDEPTMDELDNMTDDAPTVEKAAPKAKAKDAAKAKETPVTATKEAAPEEAALLAATDAMAEVAKAAADDRNDSKRVNARRFNIVTDPARDENLTEFGKETLTDRYLLPDESYQDLFARVADAYADDQEHAQRLYDYISNLWFMPATPVLSNGGTGRGLPISCYLNSVEDSLEGIVGTWNENVWLASKGGGIAGAGWRRAASYPRAMSAARA